MNNHNRNHNGDGTLPAGIRKSIMPPATSSSLSLLLLSKIDRMESGISDEVRAKNATAVANAASAAIRPESDSAVSLVNSKSNHSNDNQKTKNDAWKLCYGAAGIYLAYLAYGNMQEDLFRYRSADGSNFRNAWFLQVLESCANIVVGVAGRHVFGGTKGLPVLLFATSGASQVFAKVFTSLALAADLSFPVCILAKSSKMVPVMLGQFALGGCSYSLRDYCIAAAIVGGTALLTLGEPEKQKGVSDDTEQTNNGNDDDNHYNNTYAGLAFILVSLVMDGVTAGLQKRLKQDAATSGKIPTPYDFLLFTNMSMAATALTIALISGDWVAGWAFCTANPAVLRMISTCCVCSVVGQSFIFYIVAHFDPLVCSTVTTTRKITSVVWSIATKGHSLSEQASLGLLVAISALLLEVQGKVSYRYQQGTHPIASKDHL